MKLIFMSLFIEQYSCSHTSPTPSDHSGFEDVVVAYCSWSLRDIEPQHVSSEKSLEHILIFGRELFHAILNIQVHVT